PLTPTGELAAKGHWIRTQSATAFYHEIAVGLDDRLELRLGTPGPPLPIIGGDLQLRASVLDPASRTKLGTRATLDAGGTHPALRDDRARGRSVAADPPVAVDQRGLRALITAVASWSAPPDRGSRDRGSARTRRRARARADRPRPAARPRARRPRDPRRTRP